MSAVLYSHHQGVPPGTTHCPIHLAFLYPGKYHPMWGKKVFGQTDLRITIRQKPEIFFSCISLNQLTTALVHRKLSGLLLGFGSLSSGSQSNAGRSASIRHARQV